MIKASLFNKILENFSLKRLESSIVLERVVIDSREAQKNSLFIAFEGKNVDGHKFVEDLIQKGVVCVGSKDLAFKNYFKVDDVVAFLGDLAKEYRKTLKTKVVGITGSSGKTSTRSFVTKMLENKGFKVYSTKGNKNNHIGLPLTILNTPNDSEFLILEMGMNHKDEICYLVKIANPDFATITNIGTAHIGNFNSKEELAKAKLEIFDCSTAVAVANRDDFFIKSWIEKNKERRDIFEFSFKDIIFDDFFVPEYVVENLQTALAVLGALKIEYKNPENLLKEITFPPLRGEIIKKEEKIFVMDCYNANPDSMKKSIENFLKRFKNSSKRLYLILGEMGELGQFSAKFHKEILDFVSSLDEIETIFLFGEEFFALKNEKVKNFKFFKNLDLLKENLPKSGVFLLKGSRANKLERIVSEETK